jgi:hypothetical protein
MGSFDVTNLGKSETPGGCQDQRSRRLKRIMLKLSSEGSLILEPSKYVRLQYRESLKVPELDFVEPNVSYITRPIATSKYLFVSALANSCSVSTSYDGSHYSSSQCVEGLWWRGAVPDS